MITSAGLIALTVSVLLMQASTVVDLGSIMPWITTLGIGGGGTFVALKVATAELKGDIKLTFDRIERNEKDIAKNDSEIEKLWAEITKLRDATNELSAKTTRRQS